MNPPEDLVPREAWAAVLREAGDLVIARSVTQRTPCGRIVIGLEVQEDVIERVKEILSRFDLLEDEDPEPWTRPADWWKGDG